MGSPQKWSLQVSPAFDFAFILISPLSFQSTPFDNFLNPSVPRPGLGTEEQAGEEAKLRKLKRGATIRWFKETQAQKVMQDDGAFPSWLHGMISRR